MAAKLHYLNVLEVESVKKDDVSRALVIDKDEYVKALDIEQITTYQGLSNKPKINGVELDGDISLDELNVASKNDLNKVISDLEDVASDIPTSENIQDKIDDSLKNYATKDEVNNKQDKLISGDNIKTINGKSILGEGNITIQGEGGNIDLSEYITKTELDKKGYLTSIPSEYITETELNDKDYATNTTVNSKQDKLVSGDNIKTINGYSLLGSGNIAIGGGGSTDLSNYYTKTESDNKFQLKGDYITPDNIDSYLGTINQDITELETSKQEAFQVNQPLVFSRSGEDLVLDVNLDNYVTDTELNSKQDKLTTGDNINITNNVISWEAPNVQFVNNIFTDDASLKYTVSDFNGTSTEKTFPVATQTSAGLMSVADKTKLDNLNGSGGGGESLPYLKVGLTSIVSGDFDAVYNAIINNEPYFLQVVGSGGEYWGTYINPEGVRASNNTIQCHSEEHTLSGSYDHFNWTITADSVTVVSQYGNAIPYLKVGLNSIVAGDFNAVYKAITNNQPYFLQVTWSGGELYGYYVIPETIWANNNTIYCYSQEHKVNGTFSLHTWTITADSVTITTDNDNAIPFMQINNNEIVSGTFDEVYRAVKYNHPYFIKLYITGNLDYWGDPEMTRINGDNLECWSTYHPIDGSYTQVMWTITPDGTVTKNEWELNLVSTASYSTSTSAVEKIVTLTQDEYDAISEYDSSILYLIV